MQPVSIVPDAISKKIVVWTVENDGWSYHSQQATERVAVHWNQTPQSREGIATDYFPEIIVAMSSREEERFQRDHDDDWVSKAKVWRCQCLLRPGDTIARLPAKEASIPVSNERRIYARKWPVFSFWMASEEVERDVVLALEWPWRMHPRVSSLVLFE